MSRSEHCGRVNRVFSVAVALGHERRAITSIQRGDRLLHVDRINGNFVVDKWASFIGLSTEIRW